MRYDYDMIEQHLADQVCSERDNALDLLHRYHIFTTAGTSSSKSYSLTENFAKSLRQALQGSSKTESFGVVVTTAESEGIAIPDLDNFARNQWEGILGYMVGNSAVPLDSNAVQPSRSVKELLKHGHLIDIGPGNVPKITKEGFAFVLQDVNTQVWALLFLYVNIAETLNMSKVEVLSFLFLISSLELGLGYSKEKLSENQLRILSDLCDFGIVYQRPPSSTAPHFYPTRLAVTLTSDSATALASVSAALSSSLRPNDPSSSSSSASSAGKGFIVIETNFRLYAYTSSPLQISLLALFVNLRSRHPNLVSGKMTKRSVQRAVSAGITADQIISYLSSHAHPQMRRVAAAAAASNTSSSSTTTTTTATTSDPTSSSSTNPNLRPHSILFKDFSTQKDFEELCGYADTIGVLVWKDSGRRLFFVNDYKAIAGFMRRGKE